MSCYTCFFIRRKDDFIPIGSFGRSSTISRAFNEFHFTVPWEKIEALTPNDISQVINDVMGAKEDDLKLIDKYEKQIEEIKSIEAPLTEKLEQIAEIRENISEVREDYEDWDYAHSYLSFLLGILDEVRYSDYDEDKEYDTDNYIYFGLEIGHPTVNDIIDYKGD